MENSLGRTRAHVAFIVCDQMYYLYQLLPWRDVLMEALEFLIMSVDFG